jgi:hypothetical protein
LTGADLIVVPHFISPGSEEEFLEFVCPLSLAELSHNKHYAAKGGQNGIIPVQVAGEFGNLSMLSLKFHQLNFAFIADISCGSDVTQFDCEEKLSRIKTDRMIRLFENCILLLLHTWIFFLISVS